MHCFHPYTSYDKGIVERNNVLFSDSLSKESTIIFLERYQLRISDDIFGSESDHIYQVI